MIHPQAYVSPEAQLSPDVEIGPFSVVEPNVSIGRGCRLASHVIVKEGTQIGCNNRVCEGAVLGGLPQHVQTIEHPGQLIIGDDNVIREFCTLHRSIHTETNTTIGDHNLLMVGCHVAHDCRLGNHVIVTNAVLLAGHVEVGDRAYLGGAAAVHQYCRIGQHVMIGGHARILKDVPPFVTIDGATGLVVGLNRVGLRRSGFEQNELQQLKNAYQLIYRRGLTWNEVLEALRLEFSTGPASQFLEFFSGGTRGFVQERRSPPRATIKLHREAAPAADYKTKAG
ncbi:MAG: acyl-ACP--UDP-N-acetylglucosamine O-acyltransferase [Pirellulales bacterium]